MPHNEIAHPPQVHAYITPRALALAFTESVVLTPDEEAMDQIEAMTRSVDSSFSYPTVGEGRVTASGLAVVIRGGATTFMPHEFDGPWKNASPTQVYHPVDQLAKSSVHEVIGVRKCDIMAIGRPVLELTVDDFGALGTAMASKLTGSFTHKNRTWRTLATLTGSTGPTSGALSIGMNAKRVRAVNAVEDSGLSPFIVSRKESRA